MNSWLLIPPVALLLVVGVMWLQYLGLATFSRGVPVSTAPGKVKAYACGEDVKDHRIKPDYTQFFPFAFFFTIMHVVALMVATFPAGNTAAIPLAVAYVVAGAIGLSILYRR
jgi:NADH:ubiquinone oxidoreductase subunit 3 (subunit A)